jgi:hypothetical protein
VGEEGREKGEGSKRFGHLLEIIVNEVIKA